MNNEITLVVDGKPVDFVRKDTLTQQLNIGEKRIIAADRGWVFVGDCEDQEDGSVVIRNAKNIRRWGTTAGLGELCNGPKENTKTDNYGTVRCTPIISLAVTGGW